MSRRTRGQNIHGIVLLDKPAGISSNRALQKVRGIFQARKAGHTGSLDPFATGMLPICLGEASKTAAFMLAAGKCYRACAQLGLATTTGDTEGEVLQTCPVPDLPEAVINEVLEQFTGDIEQLPPMYSALKHQGKPLYEYARAGIEIDRPKRSVTIYELELVDWRAPLLRFDVRCSKGTYIRTLAEDLAKALGCCAHLEALRRIYTEPFQDQPMVTLEQLQFAKELDKLTRHLLPVDAGLQNWAKVVLDAEQGQQFSHGNRFPIGDMGKWAGNVRVYASTGNLLGLAVLTSEGILQPGKVFNLDPD